jgi:hypothetical protein
MLRAALLQSRMKVRRLDCSCMEVSRRAVAEKPVAPAEDILTPLEPAASGDVAPRRAGACASAVRRRTQAAAGALVVGYMALALGAVRDGTALRTQWSPRAYATAL